MKKLSIGIDIGGTNTALGVIDKEGNILYERIPHIPTPQKRENPYSSTIVSEKLLDNYITTLVSEIKLAISSIQQNFTDIEIAGIGIGAPNGNYYSGTIEFAPNLPFVGKVDLVSKLKTLLPEIGIIKLTNDANAAALGELIYGGGKGMQNFVMITLGTGVGSGIIVNGDLVYGADGFAGECGHVTIIPDGRECGCGHKGHLEAYCSASGIKRTVFELLIKNNNTESELSNLSFSELTSKHVFEAAEHGDSIAIETFKQTGLILGRALADTVHYLSPEAIFLFGGPVAADEYILKPTRESLETHLLPIFRNKVKVLKSELKEGTAAIIGASALVWKEEEKL